MCISFFFNVTAPTVIYTLSLHDALPISRFSVQGIEHQQLLLLEIGMGHAAQQVLRIGRPLWCIAVGLRTNRPALHERSEEHTSELQSLRHLVCRLLLEKKKKKSNITSLH